MPRTVTAGCGLLLAALSAARAAELLPEHVGIVRATDAHGFVPGCSMGGVLEHPDSYWTPSAKQIEAIERRLPSQLDGMNGSGDLPIELTLNGYARQYIGVVYEEKSFYYIFFFPIPETNHPLSQPYRVCDGGPKYWAILFDANSMSFGEPMFSTYYTQGRPAEKPPMPEFNRNGI